MTTLQKKLIFIFSITTCATQAPVYGMDMTTLYNTLNSLKGLPTTVWQNQTYRKALYAYLTLCIAREAYNQYYKKNSNPLEKTIYTPLRGILVQPVKMPFDVTKFCTNYVWNGIQNQPKITKAVLAIPSMLSSGFLSSLITQGIINSSVFAKALSSVSGTDLSNQTTLAPIKQEWIKIFFGLTDAMIRPIADAGLEAVFIGDPEKRQEKMFKQEETDINYGVDISRLTAKTDWAGGMSALPERIQQVAKLLAEKNSKKSFLKKVRPNVILLTGDPGLGKTMIADLLVQLSQPEAYFKFHGSDVIKMYLGQGKVTFTKFSDNVLQTSKTKKVFVFLDECESLMQERDFSGSNGTKDAAGITTAFMKFLDECKQNENITIIQASNTKIGDSAGKSRLEIIEVGYPTHQERFHLLKKFFEQAVEKGHPAIQENFLEYLAQKTNGFAQRNLKEKLVQGIAQEHITADMESIDPKNPDSMRLTRKALTAQIKEVMAQHSEKLRKLADMLTQVTHKGIDLDQTILKQQMSFYSTILKDLATNLTELNSEAITDQLINLKAELIKALDEDKIENVVRLTKNCSTILKEQYNTLTKTPEQSLLQKTLEALETGNVKAAQTELKKFDTKKLNFQTSLSEQIDLLTKIIENLKRLQAAKGTQAPKMLSDELIEQLNLLNSICTYYNRNSIIYKDNKSFDDEIALERTQLTVITEALESIKIQSSNGELVKKFSGIKAAKKTLQSYLENQAEKLIKRIHHDDIKLIQDTSKNLANIVLTMDQLKLQTLIDGLDPIKQEKDLTTQDIEKLFKEFESKKLPEKILDSDDLLVKDALELFEDNPKIKIIKEEIITDNSLVQENKLFKNAIDLSDETGHKVKNVQALLTIVQDKTTNTAPHEFTKIYNNDFKPFKKAIKDQIRPASWFSYIPVLGYFCGKTKVTPDERDITYIAAFLNQLFISFPAPKTTAPTLTPQSLVALAQVLHAEKNPKDSRKQLCALVAGFQSNDPDIIEFIQVTNPKKSTAITLLDTKTKLLSVKNDKDEEIVDYGVDIYKTLTGKDPDTSLNNNFKMSYLINQNLVKIVENSDKICDSLETFDIIKNFSKNRGSK